ncbi:MAG: serine/threonine-protein kinase [Deltaproteobacteria bacterium]|nr:serine/threonine-protein kinase [Deltaproteobacteria bacterium]
MPGKTTEDAAQGASASVDPHDATQGGGGGADGDEPLDDEDDDFDDLDDLGSLLRNVARAPSIKTLGGEEQTLPEGTIIDEVFRVVRVLGRGGMGVVYLADHLRLDRPVALKLHAAALGSTGMGRLLREARTLARLVHDNVITVYDVGTLEGQVYIAMEYVDGGTIRDWVKRSPRTPAQIIDVFLQAGRGLAAAHAAGLVHRDFKPDNVLIGADGRVRVADFGLARLADDSEHSASDSVAERVSEPSIGMVSLTQQRLTTTGALVGTPAYMAPEQHDGAPADARSDQFAFCVSLYETLFGERPFQGETWAQLVASIAQSDGIEIPTDRKVPTRVRRGLTRGLAHDPGQRYPSMLALLRAIDRRGPSARRGWWAAGLMAIAASGSVWFAAVGTTTTDCASGGDEIAKVWGDSQGEALERSLTSSSAPVGAAVGPRVRARLDEYAEGWATAYREACEATWLAKTQTAPDLDRRMACLDGRRKELAALVRVLNEEGEGVVFEADAAVLSLSPLEPCADVDALRRVEPIAKADLAAAGEVERLTARAKSLNQAGRYARAHDRAQQALTDAQALGYAVLESPAQYWLGHSILRDAKDEAAAEAFELSATRAMEAGDDRLALRAAVELIYVHGYRLERVDQAERWLRQADSLLARVGAAQVDVLARRHLYEGLFRRRQGRHADALVAIDRALTLLDTEPDSVGLRRARHSALGAKAVTLSQQGKHALAVATHAEALALAEALFGPDHPLVAVELNNAGAARLQIGELEAAELMLLRGLQIREANFGPGHRSVIETTINLGHVLRESQRYDEAATLLEQVQPYVHDVPARVGVTVRASLAGVELLRGDYARAEALFQAALALGLEEWDPDQPNILNVRSNLIALYNRQESWSDAEAAAKEALAIIEASEHEGLGAAAAYIGLELGTALTGQQRCAEARPAFTAALDPMRRAMGRTHPHNQALLHGLANCWFEEGHPEQAEEVLRQALPLLSQVTGEERASSHFLLARILWARGSRDEARRLAEQAEAEYAEIASDSNAEVVAWLAQHPV